MKVTLVELIRCIEEWIFVDTGASLKIYELQELPNGCWLEFDDLEMYFDESLTSDELAQSIFLVAGGSFSGEGVWGSTSSHRIYYDCAWPGLLGLESKG